MSKLKSRKFLYPAGQVLLIFVGVTIAMWFENMNEARKEKQFEQVLLKEMIVNLESDETMLTKSVYFSKKGVMSARKLIGFLNGETSQADSVKFYMIDVMWYNTADFNTSAYETIKSNGLHLIRNNELRQKITHYYEREINNTRDQQQIGYNLGWDAYLPLMMKRFKDFSISGGTEPVNIEDLKKDMEFKQFLHVTLEFKEHINNSFLRMAEKADKLSNEISSELK
jgi:hypothetical protein